MIFFLFLQTSYKYIVYIEEPLTYHFDRRTYFSAVREAIAYWQNYGYEILETRDSTKANVIVQWIKEFGGEMKVERLGQAILRSVVQIGIGSSSCDGTWRPFNYETIVLIATHELGHVLGFEHSDNPRDIMYPYIQYLKYDYDYNFELKLKNDEVIFLPFCTSSKQTRYYIKVESDVPLIIMAVPSKSEYQNYLQRKKNQTIKINYIKDCYEYKVNSFERECPANIGGGLIIERPRSSVLESKKVKIYIKEK